MPETPQPNEASARTETGELKPVASTPETKPPTPTETPLEPPKDSSTTPPAEKSLLNKEGDKPAAPAGAPETYSNFKAPEGYEFNEDRLKEVTPIFKELGLNQDQAQKLMDQYGKAVVESENSPFKLWQEQQEKWVSEIKSDPTIGGKLDQVKATTSKMLDGLGDPKLVTAFKEAMDYTGAGNNPAFIRTFYALAQKLTEGGAATGGGPSPAGQASGAKPASIASAMYPNLK